MGSTYLQSAMALPISPFYNWQDLKFSNQTLNC